MDQINTSLSLAKLQESILKEYKRLSYGEETPQYDCGSIYYSQIPRQLPSNIAQQHEQCIILYNFNCFEMLTFAIFQYLFTNITITKTNIVKALKKSICQQDFMFGSNYIKGLLVKGLRALGEQPSKRDKPVAQILMKNQAISAFTQLWKEIIQIMGEQQLRVHNGQPNNLEIAYISQYLGINFKLYWKKQADEFEQELIIPQVQKSNDCVQLVIIQKIMGESIINSLQQKLGNNTGFGYIILLKNHPDVDKNELIHQDQECIEIVQLQERIKTVQLKGNKLVKQFKEFYEQIIQTETN